MKSKISLKQFNDEIENQLFKLNLESLKEIIKSISKDIKPIERKYFLEKLSLSPSKKIIIDNSILEEIDSLIEIVKSRFEEEPEWDDYDMEDPSPDADLVNEISLMFDKVNAVFDYGDFQTARKAYEKLFSILELEDEYGTGIDSYDLENVDLKEIRARYFRSLYLSFHEKERIKILIEKMEKMHSFFSQTLPSIKEIIEISNVTLVDWNIFLDLWIDTLKKENKKCTNAWLREAVFLKEGILGLKKLSQFNGIKNPRVFYELVQVLKDKNKLQEALNEAEKALLVLSDNLPIRAAIADQMQELALKLQNNEVFYKAQWISFQEKPTLKKMIEIFNSNSKNTDKFIMDKVVKILESRILEKNDFNFINVWEADDFESPPYVKKSLLLHGYFFSNKIFSAFHLVSKEKELGWDYGEQLQPIFIAVCFFQIMRVKKLEESSKNFQKFWEHCFSSSKYCNLYNNNNYKKFYNSESVRIS
jgi:tetratricopeptide (TPR) repeat protein